MKKTNILFFQLCFFFLWSTSAVWGQTSIGYHSSNYAGLQAATVNPANAMNTRFAVDINLINWDINLSNNYLKVDTDLFNLKKANNPMWDSVYNGNFQLFRAEHLEETPKESARMHQQGYALGPSFAMDIGKNTFGITTAVREYFHIDNLEKNTVQMILDELENPSLQNFDLNNEKFSAIASMWSELGILYGREIWNSGEHYIRGATHLKLPFAGYSAYFYADELVVNFPNDDSINVVLSDVRFGYSDNWRNLKEVINGDTINQGPFENAWSLINRLGINVDIGFVYEWRPGGDADKAHHDETNKYKLKVGLSVVDLGVVNFERGTYGANFDDVAVNWDLNTFEANGVPEFGQLMKDSFNMTEDREPYNIRLPTSLSLQADYNILMDLYVNFTAYIAFSPRDAPLKLHALNSWSVTPRWENKWYDVGLPLVFDGYGNFGAGIAFRGGPLYLGSTNIWNYVLASQVKGLNFYGGIKIPIMRKKKGGDGYIPFEAPQPLLISGE